MKIKESLNALVPKGPMIDFPNFICDDFYSVIINKCGMIEYERSATDLMF
ncbi:MAG: hypothetical protein IPP06_09985 [Saprospiraceae bacterium]|nr:hypothetical protein [Candidatus Vicinibacter affinis]